MNLDGLEALAGGATPGPWQQRLLNGLPTRWVDSADLCVATAVYRHWRDKSTHEQNAAYIAAVSPDVVLKLIAAVRAARAYYDADNAVGAHEEAHDPCMAGCERGVELGDRLFTAEVALRAAFRDLEATS